ncbi:hypothetical protein OQA88_6971 [Cercophora sp. LCS_1]
MAGEKAARRVEGRRARRGGGLGKSVPAHFNQRIEKLCRRFDILRDELDDFSVGFFEGLTKPANYDSLTWDLCRAALSREKERRIKVVRP